MSSQTISPIVEGECPSCGLYIDPSSKQRKGNAQITCPQCKATFPIDSLRKPLTSKDIEKRSSNKSIGEAALFKRKVNIFMVLCLLSFAEGPSFLFTITALFYRKEVQLFTDNLKPADLPERIVRRYEEANIFLKLALVSKTVLIPLLVGQLLTKIL